MNRIEEIKARLGLYLNTPEEVTEDGFPHEAYGPVYYNFHDWAAKDIELLLAKLETAEKALEHVLDIDGDERALYANDIADKALKAIRE